MLSRIPSTNEMKKLYLLKREGKVVLVDLNLPHDKFRKFKLMYYAHDNYGQQDFKKTLTILRTLTKEVWPNQTTDVKGHISNCATCQLRNEVHKSVAGNPHAERAIRSTQVRPSYDIDANSKLEFESIECDGLCFQDVNPDIFKTLGCTTSKIEGKTYYANFTTPVCYKRESGKYNLCLCDWDNCNILEPSVIHSTILKVKNSSNKKKVNILIPILFLIFLITYLK
uniref:Integrase_H2C2 domain-containing protein n=1 Tax=Strongyloides stercoralis TaxID=6248 RepID=A0A0K0EF46_STRER